MNSARLAFAFVLCAALPAAADVPVPTDCAQTFPARLAETRRALAAYGEWHRQFERAAPAIDWFNAHCRFLSELEIAVRKLDDQNAFVCDTKKGRPKSLTAELVMQFNVEASPGVFMTAYTGENHLCSAQDAAERINLVFPPDIRMAEQLDVLCYEHASPTCAKSLATIEAARASGHEPPSRLLAPRVAHAQ